MLLTSGQISMTITSGIVFIFTSLLFLSGYALQQQTVRSLQAAIRLPLLPLPSDPTPTVSVRIAKPFGISSRLNEDVLSQHNASAGNISIDWTRLAYVQLLRRHADVCSAVMLFAELKRQNSNARRILLFPKAWKEARTSHEQSSTYTQTSLRLLQNAAKLYQVELLPVKPLLNMNEDLEASYPIAGLLSLTRFERLLLLQPSGLLINAIETDRLLTIPTNSSMVSFEHSSNGLIIKPSKVFFQEAMASDLTLPIAEHNSVGFKRIGLQGSSHVVTRSSDLGFQGEAFNSTAYLERVGYIRLSDPAILGPDYDIPRHVLLQSQPTVVQAGKTWLDLYELYRTRRMDICGLDLEPMPEVL